MTELLNVRDLVVEYTAGGGRVRAVDGADLAVAAGATVGIVGESGSGKSTLGLAVGGLLPRGAVPAGAEVTVDGLAVPLLAPAELRRLRRERLGFVFQDPVGSLDPTMRIGRQLRLVVPDAGGPAALRRHLERVRLPDPERVLRSYPHELSGGMAQRVAIAMAMAAEPRLLVADEPTAALDRQVRDQVMDMVFAIAAETGTGLLLLSHDLPEVVRRCARVAVMYGGRVVEEGPSAEVMADPAHPYTAALARSAPGTAPPGARIEPVRGRPPVLDGAAPGCSFAPRCAFSVVRCTEERPRPVRVRGRDVLCHRAEELVGAAPPVRLAPPAPRDGAAARPADAGTVGSGPALELDRVEVVFGAGPLSRRPDTRALRGVSLAVAGGEMVGLVGESGSGKTTLGAVALGLLRPAAGAVRFDGAPFPKRRRSLAGRMQAVLQHPQWSLNPRMRVGTSIAEPLAVLGRADRDGRAVRGMLDRVGLESGLADRYPHELSGGQRQRVSIARALITAPRFIVFDEAVSALDVSVQAQILNLIKDLQGELGFGALFISHDLGAVRYVADRIAVMRAGEIVETADTEVFWTAPEHEYSKQLMEAM
ncbi:peptide/nickel transport system ATP-binding protein [Murinocardiopsis flavida]|uniref:Peptide/nickel transport system ATP-binding protein n=1 Tax=Murinocardiopsis flavida TaxID=645275 RepID=A0A2P8DSW6_9ACTN|nr:ABC transporter ATP-binding protein [Murinocardiopsis flavida]PSL00304.1 peptide/nickel transport system ATP-binding protein [Murinocardiopsis flavida]